MSAYHPGLISESAPVVKKLEYVVEIYYIILFLLLVIASYVLLTYLENCIF